MLSIWPKWLGGWCVPGCRQRGPSRPFTNCIWKPPFFPWARAWNEAMHHFLQTPFGAHFTSFESFGRLNRSVSPVSAGLGLNVVIVVLVSIFSVHKLRGTVLPVARPAIVGWLRWTPWLALLLFMAKVGACQSARYLATYYPLLAIVLLMQQHGG